MKILLYEGKSTSDVLGAYECEFALVPGMTVAGCPTHSRPLRRSGSLRVRRRLAAFQSPNVATGRLLISIGHS
jgi:hypothetical protein